MILNFPCKENVLFTCLLVHALYEYSSNLLIDFSSMSLESDNVDFFYFHINFGINTFTTDSKNRQSKTKHPELE